MTNSDFKKLSWSDIVESKTSASYLDLLLSIGASHLHTYIYDKHDDSLIQYH